MGSEPIQPPLPKVGSCLLPGACQTLASSLSSFYSSSWPSSAFSLCCASTAHLCSPSVPHCTIPASEHPASCLQDFPYDCLSLLHAPWPSTAENCIPCPIPTFSPYFLIYIAVSGLERAGDFPREDLGSIPIDNNNHCAPPRNEVMSLPGYKNRKNLQHPTKTKYGGEKIQALGLHRPYLKSGLPIRSLCDLRQLTTLSTECRVWHSRAPHIFMLSPYLPYLPTSKRPSPPTPQSRSSSLLPIHIFGPV